jgi:hypothetical protein
MLHGSIVENDTGAGRFIAQVSLYSQSLGVATAQSTYGTDTSGKIQALRQLLEVVEFEGVLAQADALHENRLFPQVRPAQRRLLVDASLPRSGTPSSTGDASDDPGLGLQAPLAGYGLHQGGQLASCCGCSSSIIKQPGFLEASGHITAQPHFVPRSEALILKANQ